MIQVHVCLPTKRLTAKLGDRISRVLSKPRIALSIEGHIERAQKRDRSSLRATLGEGLPYHIVVQVSDPLSGAEIVTQCAKTAEVQAAGQIPVEEVVAIGD